MHGRTLSSTTVAFLTLLLTTSPVWPQEDGGKDIFAQRVKQKKPASLDADSPFNSIKPRNIRSQAVTFLPEAHKMTAEEQKLHALNRGVLAEPQGKGNAKIFATLDRRIDVYFDGAPLGDLAKAIRKVGGINVKFDTPAMDGVGIATDTPVSADLKNLLLRDAMNSILRALELAYQVRDGILYITTPEEAEFSSEARVYRVEDLTKSAQRPLIQRPSTINNGAAALIDVIKLTIAPESWSRVGGAGAITTLKLGERYLLSISQATSVHYKIAEFLAALRAANMSAHPVARKNEDVPAKEAGNEDDESTHIYPLHSDQSTAGEEMLRVVQLAIQEQGKAELALGSIAVRAPAHVHTRVSRLLAAYNQLAEERANRRSTRVFPPASGFGIGPSQPEGE